MIFRIIISFAIGFLCHQAKRVTGQFPEGWENLADHTIGIATWSPVMIMFFLFFHDRSRGETREQLLAEIAAAIGVSSIAYGCGNALAWVVEKLQAKKARRARA